MSEIRFGAYRIDQPIGGGAISTIWRAVQEPLGRTVVLKALKNEIAATSSFGAQLDREAKILSGLAHPNVVLLLDSGRTPSGRPYLVLEHVDGPSLADVLAVVAKDARKRKKLSVPSVLAIAADVCAALEHAHGHGVVHRDVKPANVILAKTGAVKLVDFGIAQQANATSSDQPELVTASGRVGDGSFGTASYMSPEQILGDFVDGRSDLFSLGVMMYEMLSGARPFDGKQKRIQRDAPVPLRERAPAVPRPVERIVMRLLERSPHERHASAAALKERLEATLRRETRADHALLVRGGLAETGFLERRETVARIVRPSSGLGRAFAGFAVLGVFFGAGVLAVERGAARPRDAAGASALELAPERAGGLRVIATPWAHVRVDGQLVDTTPFARAIPLAAGQHWVTLSHPDARNALERSVDIAAGEIRTLEVTLDIDPSDAGKDAR